jgi:hypothetical protein
MILEVNASYFITKICLKLIDYHTNIINFHETHLLNKYIFCLFVYFLRILNIVRAHVQEYRF